MFVLNVNFKNVYTLGAYEFRAFTVYISNNRIYLLKHAIFRLVFFLENERFIYIHCRQMMPFNVFIFKQIAYFLALVSFTTLLFHLNYSYFGDSKPIF